MRKTRRSSLKSKWNSGYIGFSLLIIFFLVRSVSNSFLFHKPNRLNIIFYSENPSLLSLSNKDNVNYIVNYYPDLHVTVPGGYGNYRIGALGKLVYLEKKPDIFKKTFSSASSTLVNLYFYKKSGKVYFGTEESEGVNLPSYRDILLSKSNATWLDRLYLAVKLSILSKSDFTQLDPIVKKEGDETVLDEEEFAQEYRGFFYQKSYRNERRSVQIMFTNSRNNAVLMSRILESSGIRVVDNFFLSDVQKKCTIVENSKFSETARDLSRFLDCPLKRGETRLSDIIIVLGSEEERWAFK